MIYKIRKTYKFRDANQAEAFLDIADLYGKGRTFGNIVFYEAALEFSVWRKFENLAKLISECNIRDIDIYSMTSQAGFKVFKKAGMQ